MAAILTGSDRDPAVGIPPFEYTPNYDSPREWAREHAGIHLDRYCWRVPPFPLAISKEIFAVVRAVALQACYKASWS